MSIRNNTHDGTISAFNGKFALEHVQEELDALYALASAALHDLEPKDGQAVDELPHFVGFQLVKLMHERLECASFIDCMRGLLAPGQATTNTPITGDIK